MAAYQKLYTATDEARQSILRAEADAHQMASSGSLGGGSATSDNTYGILNPQ
jgi:hypothetical protein